MRQSLAWLVLCAAPLAAQAPLLRLQPSTNPGQPLQSLLTGAPGKGFATLLAPSGEPLDMLGERLWLAPLPAAVVIDSGLLDAIGMRALAIPTPGFAALAGRPLFAQSVVLDGASPNGLFRASNGQSAILHLRSAAIVLEFRDAAAEGVTGTFDGSVKERLMAGPIVRRTRTIAPASGYPFQQGVATPLVKTNARLQHVYRAGDLGASGEPEVVTALRWKPYGPVVADTFQRVQITLAHTTIVPDYTVDPFSALPKYPGSGLGTSFAANYKTQEQPVTVCDGPYAVQPAAVRPDGFLAWPAPTAPFVYNGYDSLLVDYRVVAGAAALGANGFTTRIMVLSSAQPNTRVFAPGNLQPPIDPFAVTTAQQGDNTCYELQLELTRNTTYALTRFVKNPGTQARYDDAMVAFARPVGTYAAVLFEGAMSESGAGAPGYFSPSPTFCNGYPWIRARVEFSADAFDGARPSVDTIVIPVQ